MTLPPGWPTRSRVRRRHAAARCARHHALPRRPEHRSRRVPWRTRRSPRGGIDDTLVILVDDVLYSGRSRALGAGRPARHRPAAGCWRCWSTAVIANCRCRRTTSARTCRPRAAKGARAVHRGRRPRRGGDYEMSPRHLLSASSLTRDDATAILDDADRFSQALLGREVKKLPTLRGRTVITMFYENSTNPGVVRGGRQVDERRRHQRQRVRIVGGQGRVAARHRADTARGGSRRADHPPSGLRRRPAARRVDRHRRRRTVGDQRRRRHPRTSHAGTARRADHPAAPRRHRGQARW